MRMQLEERKPKKHKGAPRLRDKTDRKQDKNSWKTDRRKKNREKW